MCLVESIQYKKWPSWSKLQQKRSMIFLVALYMYFNRKKVLSPQACAETVTGGEAKGT